MVESIGMASWQITTVDFNGVEEFPEPNDSR